MIDDTHTHQTRSIDEPQAIDEPPGPSGPPQCWFCGRVPHGACKCGRAYCNEHTYNGHCLICALGFGLFETTTETEPISGLLMVSLSTASGDAYIVRPPDLRRVRPLPIQGVERVVAALVKMLRSDNDVVQRRAAAVLAATTNSWPTMNPSQLIERNHGTSLLAADQVRRWLLHTLEISRSLSQEPTALAILDKLRTADFRDLYPGIQDNFTSLSCSSMGTRVRDVFDAVAKYYPSHSHLANERCELLAYEAYTNKVRGAGKHLERLYGPLLKYSPVLNKMLKKGTWLTNQALYEEWFYGESEPL